jgi:branched-chain amino acid transport system substrate-binding protein
MKSTGTMAKRTATHKGKGDTMRLDRRFVMGVLAAALVLAGVGPASGQEQIVVGAVFSQTGAISNWGQGEAAAVRFVIDKANRSGKLGARKIVLVERDDRSDSRVIAQVGRELVADKRVIAILGSSGSGPTTVLKQITAEAGVPHLGPVGAPQFTESGFEHFYRTYVNDEVTARAVLDIVRSKLDKRRIAVINSAEPFGEGKASQLQRYAKDFGVEIVAHETFPVDAADMTAQLTAIKRASPEVLVTWTGGKSLATLFKNIRQLGFAIPVMGSPTSGTLPIVNAAGHEAVEGVIFPAQLANDMPRPGHQADAIREWVVETGKPFDNTILLGYQTAEALVHALHRMTADRAEFSRATLKAYLDRTAFESIGGPLRYTPTSHEGFDISAVEPIVIRGGKSLLLRAK